MILIFGIISNNVFERVLFRKRKDDRYMVDILETLFIEFVRSLLFLEKKKNFDRF